MAATETRRQITEAADTLFYERGFEATSFADIAAAVGLSRGNFYYHFKTKDEILEAVIDLRMAKTRAMLAGWAAGADEPVGRIAGFIHMLIANRAGIMAHGCPVGTLCSELAKLDHVAKDRATELFGLFRDWLAQQFSALGRDDDAERLALHLLVRSQGIAALATAFRDEAFIRREVAAMETWLAGELPGLARRDPSLPNA
ncbi:MAG: TetR/AcrR family transcriptional regulator [Phreatobacter sp.]|uniref:TetR/AcrR family transcriptional regulator n=1 Tax=Phreatobacter sp. TaxID=1966341 RepID=UPI001A603199|nr:TetR family transcriptional regulator [Phreatobacter sp.]MBL8571194.1 TetR/AcrR family transcriptional regulator [Phreatobacter sp.]